MFHFLIIYVTVPFDYYNNVARLYTYIKYSGYAVLPAFVLACYDSLRPPNPSTRTYTNSVQSAYSKFYVCTHKMFLLCGDVFRLPSKSNFTRGKEANGVRERTRIFHEGYDVDNDNDDGGDKNK